MEGYGCIQNKVVDENKELLILPFVNILKRMYFENGDRHFFTKASYNHISNQN